MKNILTAVAAAGLLSAFAASAQAQVTGGGSGATVTFPGTVPSSCKITAATDGSLVPNVDPATNLSTANTGGTNGGITVVCNTATQVLTIAQDTAASSIQTQSPAPTVAVGFAGGSGVYTGASGLSSTSTSVTNSAGDVANVRGCLESINKH